MLQLKNIKKDYVMENNVVKALKGVSINFRKNEFVAILGESGGGKSTLLNVIGGLDAATSGDLLIDGRSIKKFQNKDYDSYRNNSIGFIFQNYNLISHLTVYDNIAMGMTLNGKNKKAKDRKVAELLERVGLSDQIYKKPNQLSGGQMQRVAIARALANNPEIILADEPTGALDSVTSAEIMALITEISKETLVIMVTHSEKIAKDYSNRIVKLKDGMITDDSNPFEYAKEEDTYLARNTSMKFKTAIKLSFNNIITKKFRTLITAFALSIGIIGIALVLSVNNGFSSIIDSYESQELIGIPLLISNGEQLDIGFGSYLTDYETVEHEDDEIVVRKEENIVVKEHTNVFTQEYLDYLQDMDEDIYNKIFYDFNLNATYLIKTEDSINTINDYNLVFGSLDFEDDNHVDNYYELVGGTLPTNTSEIVITIKPDNEIEENFANALNLSSTENINFDEVIGTEIYVPSNNDLYIYNEDLNIYLPNTNYDEYIDSENTKILTITGILMEKEEGQNPGYNIITHTDLESDLLTQTVVSDICLDFNNFENNLFSNTAYTSDQMQSYIKYSLGCENVIPSYVSISFESVNDKEEIKAYLDVYNADKPVEEQIEYQDVAAEIINTLGSIIDIISIALIVFASIALVVSSIMIGIIMYISVLERTKEIGVLRALGARKKDIKRVFSSESIIIGTIAGITAIVTTYLLNQLINVIVANYEPGLENIAVLDPITAIELILLSIAITLIGGIIPAIMASKKDPVVALRSE